LPEITICKTNPFSDPTRRAPPHETKGLPTYLP